VNKGTKGFLLGLVVGAVAYHVMNKTQVAPKVTGPAG